MNLSDLNGVVFFDLDGTLLNNQSKLDSDVIEAIQALKNNNILPVICTGRSPHEIEYTKKMTDISTTITLNGSLVMDNTNVIYQRVIPTDLCESVINFANSYSESLVMFNKDKKASTIADSREIIESHKGIAEEVPAADPDFYKNNIVNMIVVYTTDAADKYQNKFSDLMKFYKTGLYSIDCVMKEESKKNGIKELIKQLNLTDVPTFAFGDGPNDIEMLDYVDHSIVMGNARKDIFEHGEFITTKNIDHGIVNGLKHFNLI